MARIIQEEDLQKLLAYLANQPYNQVVGAIQALANLPVMDEPNIQPAENVV